MSTLQERRPSLDATQDTVMIVGPTITDQPTPSPKTGTVPTSVPNTGIVGETQDVPNPTSVSNTGIVSDKLDEGSDRPTPSPKTGTHPTSESNIGIVFDKLDEGTDQPTPSPKTGTHPTSESNTGAVVDKLDEGTDLPPGPISVGEALESVAGTVGDKEVTVGDARAIQAAEARVTGVPSGVKGGPAAYAQRAVDHGTLSDVLANARARLPNDKPVDPKYARAVHSAETRNNAGQVVKGGVASTMNAAAAYNVNAGFVSDPNAPR